MFCFDLSVSNLRISVSVPTSNFSTPRQNRITPPNSDFHTHPSVPTPNSQHPTSPTQNSPYLLHLLKISPQLYQQHTAISATVMSSKTRHQARPSNSHIWKEDKGDRPDFQRSKVHVAATTRDVLNSFLDSGPLTIGQILCSETSVRYCHCTPSDVS